MSIEYPNREHQNADQAARRRLERALDDIISQAEITKRRLHADRALDASNGRTLLDLAGRTIEHLSAMETLRDVREWAAADRAEAKARAEAG